MNPKVGIMFLLISLVVRKAMLSTTVMPEGLHDNGKENMTTYATDLADIALYPLRDTTITKVAFMATLTHDIIDPSVGHTVVFDQENLDTTNSYNPNIGIYTVPVSGVYYISLTATTKQETPLHYIHLFIKKDGTSVGYLFLDDNDIFWLRRNEVVLVHLNAGDSLYVQVDYAVGPRTLIGGGFNTHFQGFMIFSDKIQK